MFGTRAADSTLFIAIGIALTLVLIISFCIWLMNIENNIAGTICLTLCIIAIVYVAAINIYSKKQERIISKKLLLIIIVMLKTFWFSLIEILKIIKATLLLTMEISVLK